MVERSKPNTGAKGKVTQKTTGSKATPGGGIVAKNLPQGKSTSKDDYECPICLNFCAQPVITPCKHFFCLSCSKGINQQGMTCPLCRADFDKLFIPAVDTDLQQKIAQMYSSEFEEAKAELIKEGEWRGNKIPLRFAFGNTHEDVKNPKQSRSNPGVKNTHRWVMFVVLNNDKDATQKYIKQVTYHLHPTFKPSQVTVSQAPFLLSRVGWGYFTLGIDITFQDWTKMGTMQIKHELCFDDNGKTQSFDVDVDGDHQEGSTVNELTKLMKDLKIKAENSQDE